MTTAHRPTFHNAIADDSSSKRVAPTKKVHARELAAQTVLKERQTGQGSREELKEHDFKAALDAKEAAHFGAKRRAALLEGNQHGLTGLQEPRQILQLEDIPDEPNPFPDDADDEGPRGMLGARKASSSRKRGEKEGGESSEGDDDDDDGDDDDEEAELLRELENIKQERAEEEAKKKEAEERMRAESEKELIATSNPLVVMSSIADAGGGSLSRGWEDDAVFKNQAKISATQKADLKKKRFINDPVRSEFHKKFLQKYVS